MLKKLIALAAALALTTALLINIGNKKVNISETELITIDEFHEIPALPAVDTYGMMVDEFEIVEDRIQRNESLYVILNRHGVSRETIHYIQQAASGKVSLNRMMAGQKYRVYKNDDRASAFVWHRSAKDYTTITWGDEIEIENGSIPVETQIASVSGTIRSSLANAISSQGVSQRLVVELANIYAWTVDFYGLRTGDQFKAVYENRYVDGEYIGIGQIKAAEFEHRGHVLRAYYYHNGEQGGYYDEEGNSMRRAMMRVPFEYNPRISSGFSHNRMHPILNQRRPHYGTDYAAPTGTPILAAGDGVVTEAQHRGGNGNIVQVRHNSVYRTAYLHMSRFASGIRPGVRVQQGQVIGYVGQTGLATGPHLCYRLYKNNQPINSVTYDFPPDEGLSDAVMGEYIAEVRRLDEMLDTLTDPSGNLAGLH
jgi:murein DD-endopeptidase MepM/ murein hydrolase activator NlpD